LQFRFKRRLDTPNIIYNGERFSGYNKPKRTPNHPKKSHVVLAKESDKMKESYIISQYKIYKKFIPKWFNYHGTLTSFSNKHDFNRNTFRKYYKIWCKNKGVTEDNFKAKNNIVTEKPISIEETLLKFSDNIKKRSKIYLKEGDHVNNWTIKRFELKGKNKVIIAQCICGKEKVFWKNNSVLNTKTCGCGLDKSGLTSKQRRTILLRMQGYKSGAKNRNIKWCLTYDEFVKASTKNCFYCNEKPRKINAMSAPSLKADTPNFNYNDYNVLFTGLDRLDSSKDYTLNNVVSCCVMCNRAKSDMTIKEFKNHIKKIYEWMFN
jgi:5-methylcytosine-specific restriction endonuclease McrA